MLPGRYGGIEGPAGLDKAAGDIVPRAVQAFLLFGKGHVQLVIAHAALTVIMVAHHVQPFRMQQLQHLAVQGGGIAFVPQFMHGLNRYHGIEHPQTVAPVSRGEIALDEGHAPGKFTKAFASQGMHGR